MPILFARCCVEKLTENYSGISEGTVLIISRVNKKKSRSLAFKSVFGTVLSLRASCYVKVIDDFGTEETPCALYEGAANNLTLVFLSGS